MAKKRIAVFRSGDNAGATVYDGGKKTRWDALSRDEQVSLLNALASIYELFYNHLKPE
jgi:hypothetical protein